MLNNFKLRQKFTIFLLLIFIGGLGLSGAALIAILRQNARDEIASKALILMETMNSVREYTSSQVKPELADRLDAEFLPETIPAYSAREVFETFRSNDDYREFFYKEATLNPSNLRDKADSFEKTIVDRFRKETNTEELEGFRAAAGGDLFYIARPIKISKESCLECHSTPDVAPASMIERYGAENGFGWKLNEIVGAQIISVPNSSVVERTRQSFLLVMGIVSLVFLFAILLVNVLLNRSVIRPLKRIAHVAEEVSTGNMNVDFGKVSNDEVGNLAQAFSRMKMSLEMAMQRLNRYRQTKS
jgi:HAMP domain-containing protein